MHAGFRRLAPDMKTVDLDEPYLVALEMFELEKRLRIRQCGTEG